MLPELVSAHFNDSFFPSFLSASSLPCPRLRYPV
jgi:hypothetical protein